VQLSKIVTIKQANKIEEKMSIQGNLQKLKKAQAKNKPVYVTYGNYERVNGKISNIGNVFVEIEQADEVDDVMIEIEKISDISLLNR
jgi:hypothetical protein